MRIGQIKFEWKPQDCWIGAFWKTHYADTDQGKRPFLTDLWVCVLPMIPLHVQILHSFYIEP